MDALLSQSRRKLRPSVEGLESLRLLSGMAHAVAAHPVAVVHAEATKASAAVAVVHLHGTIHATVKLVSASTLAIAGSGNLGSVGAASINFRLTKTGALPTSTLSTKLGKITLAGNASALLGGGSATSPGANSLAESFPYTVVGGTGAYARSTGSGTLTETVTLSKGDVFTVNLKFS